MCYLVIFNEANLLIRPTFYLLFQLGLALVCRLVILLTSTVATVVSSTGVSFSEESSTEVSFNELSFTKACSRGGTGGS